MSNDDLNDYSIDTHDDDSVLAKDHSTSDFSGNVRVYFRNLEAELCDHIGGADLVVGCVAWLTNERILEALAGVRGGVAIVVQKEDFLRPDLRSGSAWKPRLRAAYDRLPRVPERHAWPGLLGAMSTCSDPRVQPVRCVGNYNRDRAPAFPRMHNKFLVFCRASRQGHDLNIEPFEVWTGSFNLTYNASRSLENAVAISSERIARAYFAEWEQIEAISEPLDWHCEWSAPQWRIGS